MKAHADQPLLRREAAHEFANRRPGGIQFPVVLALLVLFLLCGCSSFNRDWRKAANQSVPPDSIEGRWEGSWISDVNGHNGKLRCLLTREEGDQYRARFRATYRKVLRFSYTVPLTFREHDAGWEFDGEADLGKLGGAYYCEGRASLTNLHSTYRSKYDHGIFKLHRPE